MVTNTGKTLLEKTAIWSVPLKALASLGPKLLSTNLRSAIPNAYSAIKAPVMSMWNNRQAVPMLKGGITNAYTGIKTGLQDLPSEQLTSLGRLGKGVAAAGLVGAGFYAGNKAYNEEDERLRRLQDFDRYRYNMAQAQGRVG